MKIEILTAGKIKEKFYQDAVNEYKKRLTKYCSDITIIEVPDEKTPDNPTDAQRDQVLQKEGAAMMSKLEKHINSPNSYIITLEINGKELSSEKLAKHIDDLGIKGISTIVFVIGGSLGLHESITKKADFHLSFSPMTFPHQLMRVILLEQIYRSFRIIKGEPYHK